VVVAKYFPGGITAVFGPRSEDRRSRVGGRSANLSPATSAYILLRW